MEYEIDDVMGCAFAVWLLGRHQSKEFLAALGWVVKRRAQLAKTWTSDHSGVHPQFGNGRLTDAAKSLLQDASHLAGDVRDIPGSFREGVASTGFLKALATTCLVITEDVADPTGGAVYCHHHLENPTWAVRCEPSALIGPMFFYDQVQTRAHQSIRINVH